MTTFSLRTTAGSLFLILVICLQCTTTALVNVTVDDTFPDPLTGLTFAYSPQEAWQTADCAGGGCALSADRQRAGGHTWHESTYFPKGSSNSINGITTSASLLFDGSAVYIYCIISHSLDFPAGRSAMTFFLDGQQVGKYLQDPTGSPDMDYNVLVYANGNIKPGHHVLRIDNNGGDQTSLIILDYIMYTYDDGLSSSASPHSIAHPRSRPECLAKLCLSLLVLHRPLSPLNHQPPRVPTMFTPTSAQAR